MFQLHFADATRFRLAPPLPPAPAEPPPLPAAERVLLLYWEEHCVECAIPDCFSSCPLYRRRRDGRCARFDWGIYPNRAFRGRYPFGADVRFGRWAKLEAALADGYPVPPAWLRPLQAVDRVVGRLRYRALDFLRRRPALRRRLRADDRFDEFVVECHAPEGTPFRLLLERFVLRGGAREPISRHALHVGPGFNRFRIPAEAFRLRETGLEGHLCLQPEEDGAGRRLIFTRLEFVRYAGVTRPAPPAARLRAVAARPAEKVKVVAWDLDGTLWDGTLVESDPGRLALRPGVAETMRALDERGILQTVSSKNDAALAFPVLERLGVAEFLLHPEIHWGQKSLSLRRVAEALNLGLDAFALVDDSPFEREEVRRALPQVRLYTERDVEGLLARPEFDVPVTAEARVRRASYRAEERRRVSAAGFTGDYLGFLRHCDIRGEIFRPAGEAEVARCLELLKRSNQLNLRTFRYDEQSFVALLANRGFECHAVACRDRFGDYGIVGFASVDRTGAAPRLVDLVLSCRVAQKRVEHSLIAWIAARERARGSATLDAEFVATGRNTPLRGVFSDLPFERVAVDGPRELLRWPLDRPAACELTAAIAERP